MDVIIIIGAVQALIFFLLLQNKKKRSYSDQILRIWFLVMALHLCIIYILSPEFLNLFPHLTGIHVGFPLLYGPFLYLYTNSLVNGQHKIKTVDWLHFIPFLLIYLLLIPFYSKTTEEKLAIINGFSPYKNYYGIGFQIFFGLVYVIWVLVLLKKYRKKISEHFSFTDKVELKWLQYLTTGLLIIWLMVIFSNLFFSYVDSPIKIESKHIIYTTVTIFIFVIGFKGLKQGIVYTQEPVQFSDDISRSNPQLNKKKELLDEQEVLHIIEKLEKYMKEEKPYLDENLMLTDLASYLNIPQYKLTRIFNEHLNQSFFNYINHYRVDAFKTQIAKQNNEVFTILSMAYDCGFASKASFYRIFKQLTGQTPSDYKRELKKHNT